MLKKIFLKIYLRSIFLPNGKTVARLCHSSKLTRSLLLDPLDFDHALPIGYKISASGTGCIYCGFFCFEKVIYKFTRPCIYCPKKREEKLNLGREGVRERVLERVVGGL